MNYIGLLTPIEAKTLCDMITGARFKAYFERHEKELAQTVQKKSQVAALNETYALEIAKENIHSGLVSAFVNKTVDAWLTEVKKRTAILEKIGLSHSAALAGTLSVTVFADHAELYLKLAGLDPEKNRELLDQLASVRADRKIKTEPAVRIETLETEVRRLTEEREASRLDADRTKQQYELQISELEEGKARLESELETARETIAELETARSESKPEEPDPVTQFDDTVPSALSSVRNGQTVSLCEIYTDGWGRKWLRRHADLNPDGRFSEFRKDERQPPAFGNNTSLYFTEQTLEEGFFGVWTWSSVPKEDDPSRDFISSSLNRDIDAIQIVPVKGALDPGEIVSLLKRGMQFSLRSRKVMFCCISRRQYTGVLCTAGQLVSANGRISLSKDCFFLPVYKFSEQNVLSLSGGLSFWKNAFAGVPARLAPVKDRLEVVSRIVLSSVSWPAFKARGVSEDLYRQFRNLLSLIPADSILAQIQKACRCDESDAKASLEEFLRRAGDYVDGHSLEDAILQSALAVSPDLQARSRAMLRTEWEAENQSLLAGAKKELDSLEEQISAAKARLTGVQSSLQASTSEEKRLSTLFAEREQLAADVEQAVSERIRKARENAAQFIAEMAFVTGQNLQPAAGPGAKPAAEPELPLYGTVTATENPDDLTIHHSWGDGLEAVVRELGEAGVSSSWLRGLAAFLCAAYLLKQPVLLVGPNADEIARAFSAALKNRYGVLCCEGDGLRQAVREIGAEGEDIVIVSDLLPGGWTNRISTLLARKDIFYLFTHPCAEDIQAEPRSLFGFMLPLFTEFVIQSPASGTYAGGTFAEDCAPCSVPKGGIPELRAVSCLTLSPFVKSRISTLAAVMRDIDPGLTEDDVFLYAVFQTAYATLETDRLAKAIADPQGGIPVSAGLKQTLKHVLGDPQESGT